MITPTRVFADRSDANRYFIEFEHVVGVRTLRHGEVIDVANLGSCRVDSAEPCAAHITALPFGGQDATQQQRQAQEALNNSPSVQPRPEKNPLPAGAPQNTELKL